MAAIQVSRPSPSAASPQATTAGQPPSDHSQAARAEKVAPKRKLLVTRAVLSRPRASVLSERSRVWVRTPAPWMPTLRMRAPVRTLQIDVVPNQVTAMPAAATSPKTPIAAVPYAGLLEPIRKAFARTNGVKPALFSSNSEGACPNCNGAGVIYTDLAMMAGVATTCEVCEGRRFEASVLDYKLGGRDISEVLAMPVTEARGFFGTGEARTPAAHAILQRLDDVGLGYLSLGQPLTTLSGGERQRLKLATRMGEKGGVLILDEPTTGLHLADVEQLLGLLDRLVDSGKSVVVIEHHQAVMAHADWIIDLGPGAGHEGGRIVFEGPPAQLVAERATLTGRHLARYVDAAKTLGRNSIFAG